ncbi:MAG TPA: DUF6676 family protein [Nakamurella sp.]|nr:DUF6676 family protein [Nakamurella sp.]
MKARAWRLASALAAVTVIAGCATTVAGSPGIDPAAASALATTSASIASPVTSSSAESSAPVTSSADSSSTPVPPVPPSTSASSPAQTSTSEESSAPTTSESAQSSDGSTDGLPIDAIVAALRDDPVVGDKDARAAADKDELNDLDDQVVAAQKAGLAIWVVLIGHDVDELLDAAEAVNDQLDGTVVMVDVDSFAINSKDFDQDQLSKAEDAASAAATGVEAASILVAEFRGMMTEGTASTSTAAGSDDNLTQFQLADHSMGCAIIDDMVRCDLIVPHTYKAPKNPHPDCQGDYGSSIQMSGTDPAAFICVSDTVYDPGLPVLADGDTTVVGTVLCYVEGPEVTCLDATSLHGFSLSPTEFETY